MGIRVVHFHPSLRLPVWHQRRPGANILLVWQRRDFVWALLARRSSSLAGEAPCPVVYAHSADLHHVLSFG
jgi:hypothetical protein